MNPASGPGPQPAAASEAELDERRLQSIAEQAAGLRWQVLLTAVIVVAIVWEEVPPAAALLWLALAVGIREVRARALGRMVSDRATPVATRLRRTVQWNLALGLANGSAALFMLKLDVTLDAVLTMILVSWGAGAVSTSATLRPAFLAYASAVFLPIAAMWMAIGGWLGWGLATLVLMFFGVQIRFARQNLAMFEESFRIRRENVDLAARLAQESAELARARDEAVRANLAKSHFLAAASHDLRQPLQALALNSGELVRLPVGGEAQAIAQEVASSIDDLRCMLDGLLDVSQLDVGVVAPHPRSFPLRRLLEAVTTSFRAAAASRQLTISCDCPASITVHTDPELLRRVLANLVDNALKFTHRGGVTVLASVGEAGVKVEVRDTGPGIEPQDRERIFDDLVRLEGGGRDNVPGHGLGLGIVRRLVALLDVGLDLDSAPDQGTTFRLTLAAGQAELAGTAPLQALPELDGLRVLVVEDDRVVREAYLRHLRRLGCRVWAADGLTSALELFEAQPVQLLVVDFRLRAGQDGFEVVRRLRARDAALKAVMVSADMHADLVQAAHDADVRLLRKPVDEGALARAVEAAAKEAWA